MSSISETQEGVATCLNCPSKPMKTNTTPIYPSPPNSQPQTELSLPEAQTESEDEFRSPDVAAAIPLSPPTSPPLNSSNSMRSAERPVEAQSRMNASTLKISLGLGDWRCGCVKRDGLCRNPIRAERKKQLINSHIESIKTLTQSSPELEAELEKLFSLVHCHHHSEQIGDRVEKWNRAFPVGDADTKQVVSIEKQIKEALGRLSVQCIWETLEGEPCVKRIGGQRVHNCANTIYEIVKPEVYLEDAHLDYLLEVLETNMYCPDHIDKPQFKRVALWKLKAIEIRKTANSELIPPIKNDVLEEFTDQTGVPKTPETGSLSTEKCNNFASHGRGLLTLKNSPSWSAEFNEDRASFWPKAYDTSPFHITSRVNGLADYSRIREKLKQPLKGRDLEDGYVYMYEVEGNERFVKIGWTARTVEIRHEQWTFDCNRKTKALYPIHPQSAIAIPNAQRVEALCHAELHHCRTTIYCKGCLMQHTEWFEVSPAEAIAVIAKWSNWMASRPYQSHQLRSGVKWTLKEEAMRRVRDIDQFMNKILAAATLVTSEHKLEKARERLSSIKH